MARHYKPESPPEAERKTSVLTMAGAATLRQVHLALTDLRLHEQWRAEYDQSPAIAAPGGGNHHRVASPGRRRPAKQLWPHLLGATAPATSYKWAEVLSADAFSAFDAGLDDEQAVRATGRRFRDTVLSRGGSEAPADVFAFRGRPPSAQALLRHSGWWPPRPATAPRPSSSSA